MPHDASQINIQPILTKAEAVLWYGILKYDRTGHRFLRQKIIDSLILDYYCPKLRLGIELNGGCRRSQNVHDIWRNEILSDYGIKIIRYTDNDIEHDLNGVFKDLKEEIKIREQELLM